LVHASGSGSFNREDQPLKLSTWHKEDVDSSFESSHKGRSWSRKHRKEKVKPIAGQKIISINIITITFQVGMFF
jgi:hypothetical protein